MRPSVLLLIAGKEIRDLIRDRRTVMLIIVLPALLYPLFGAAGYVMAQTLLSQTTRVGIAGLDRLPADPALVRDGEFRYQGTATGDDGAEKSTGKFSVAALDGDANEALREKRFDLAILVPENFRQTIADPKLPVPTLTILNRDGDEKSKLGARKLSTVLDAWQKDLRERRFATLGLPKSIDTIFLVDDPISKKPPAKKAADELRDTFVKVFPFILIMWLVAGVIQPAVDVTAGERERGTMETLLISPVSRVELVLGKWLATTAFGFASVIWNVIWLVLAAIVMEWVIGYPIVNVPGLIGCVAFSLPIAMLYSAVGIALGIFAKSTKEGQYYLMPVMLGTMPLAFWSMVPSQELTGPMAAVPVTGAMLFQQRLLAVNGDPVPWRLAPVIFASLGIALMAALIFAVRQFRRESVLFRESAGGGFFSRNRP